MGNYALITVSNEGVEDVWELTDDPRDSLREFKNHNPSIKAYTRRATKKDKEYIAFLYEE